MRTSTWCSELAPLRISVDIGGTFTDLVGTNDKGSLWNVKVLTTPEEPSVGVMNALDLFTRNSKHKLKEVGMIVHATTLASNALLTGKISRVALVTTSGFRDVLEIGRQNRPELYNLQVERPPPLVPRENRFTVRERISYDGKVLVPLDRKDATKVAKRIRRLGLQSISVCFLHSYVNPRHEKEVGRILKHKVPRVKVTLSSDLLPEFREYERTSTTVVNSCLQPVISTYLEELREKLHEKGIRAQLFMMQSNGGTISAEQAVEQPARIIESGPVAGAVAARHYGKLSHAGEVVSLDIGGTTSKAGVWAGDKFEFTTEYEVGGKLHGIRRLEGSGYPVRFPIVDLIEVGTGGGSIARVDDEGTLHVGPSSAGANPGPACYGRGGPEATVSDAHIVLGRLNPSYLLGGDLRVYPELAEKAIETNVARRLHATIQEAALGMLRVAIDNMVGALRTASVERGRDPRQMLLVGFGGAGPMHACEIALELGIKKVLVPTGAGLFSSLGLLLAEPLRDYVQTILIPMTDVKPTVLERLFRRMESRGRDSLIQQGVKRSEVEYERYFDLRYVGQAYELPVRVATRRVDRGLLQSAQKSFHEIHNSRYGYSDSNIEVELVNLRLNCRGRTRTVGPNGKRPTQAKPIPVARRVVTFLSGTVMNSPIYDRRTLGRGFHSSGPAILEDYDSTTILPPGAKYDIDARASVHVSLA